MIIYNLGRLYRARGIGNPSSFLRKHGFSNGTAGKLSKDRVKGVHVSIMEKLCEILVCTPNELMEWIPDKDSNIPSGHPLHSIRKRNDVNMTNILKSVPIEAIERMQQFIESETGNVISEEVDMNTSEKSSKKSSKKEGNKTSNKSNSETGNKAKKDS